MKFYAITLFCVGLAAGIANAKGLKANPAPKTLSCQVTYDSPNPADAGNRSYAKLPLASVKLVRDTDAPRLNGTLEIVTPDGRFKVDAWGLQPAKGDFTNFEQIGFSITDSKLKTVIEPQNDMVGRFTRDVNHAEASVSTEYDPNNYQNSSRLDVACDLK